MTSRASIFFPASGGMMALILYTSLLLGCPYAFLKDGATARHINTGLFILAHHLVPTTNYTWSIDPSRPWLTHELLSDIVFGIAYQLAGLNAIILLSAIALTLALMWLYQMARARGLGALSSWVFFYPALIVTTMHWSARPHLFSYPLFVLMYYVQFVTTSSIPKRSITAALLSVVWINLHGSAVFGLMMVACGCFGKLLPGRRESWKELIPLAACAVALCFNNRGIALYDYVFHYVTDPTIFHQGNEWLPFTLSFGIQSYCFLFLIALPLLLFLFDRKLPSQGELALFFLLIYMGFHAMRLEPYLAMASLLIVGPTWASLKAKAGDRAPFSWESRIEVKEHFDSKFSMFTLLIAMAFSLYFMLSPGQRRTDFYDDTMPTGTSEYIRTNCTGKTLFLYDNWGPYIYWKTHQPVFIDDKTDFYPREFIDDYITILQAKPGWQKLLERYKLEYVLANKGLELDLAAKKDLSWKQVAEDRASVLYRRLP